MAAEVDRQLAELPRREIAEAALRAQGVALVVDSAEQAVELVSRIAPEHAGLALADAARRAARVTAGAVFVGHHASESVGDYFAGPSHVLPTGGSARFCSPLGVGRLPQAHLAHRIHRRRPWPARPTDIAAPGGGRGPATATAARS